jgi:putative ABC transport system permease protein
MTILYRIRALVRWLFRRDEIERALDSDIKDYIERSAAEKMRAGMSEAEAKRAARIELGGVEQTKDSVRATLSLAPIENMLTDLRLALRTMSRQKTFTSVAVLTLALGIGVNVAIFSLFQQILLRPLPVAEPDSLVNLTDPSPKLVGQMTPPLRAQERPTDSGGLDTLFSYPMFRDLERAQEPFVGLAAYASFDGSVSAGQQARLLKGVVVSGSYFPLLGLKPALGRLLGVEDDRVEGQAEAVVLSHPYWQSEFDGDPGVLGRTLTVNDVPLTVVGVAPREFLGMAVGSRPSIFVPITIKFPTNDTGILAQALFPNHTRRDFYWAHLFARLRPGVTREAAEASMNSLYSGILSQVEVPLLANVDEQQRTAFGSRALMLKSGSRGQTSRAILSPARDSLDLLLAVCGTVLLLCCANVAGLILLRATTRSGELALRVSLGATRVRLASLQTAESLVIALPAAIMSLPVAWLTLRGASQVPGIAATASDASLSATAAFVAIGIAVASSLAIGLLPVRGLLRIKPGSALQAYGARHTTSKGVACFRAALATAQVALSMALLAMTAVFAQSLANIARLDLGVKIESVVMFEATRGPDRFTDTSLFGRVEEALEALPGVSSVARSGTPALSLEASLSLPFTVEGLDAEALSTFQSSVSADFFQTFDVELLAGRTFNDTDSPITTMMVNQRFAEHFGLSPDEIVGRTLSLGRAFRSEIVGVVANMRTGKVTDDIVPQAFRHLATRPTPGADGRMGSIATASSTFYVRSSRPPEELMNAVRETVARVDPTMPITNLQTMEQQFRTNVGVERFVAGTSTALAVLGTVLAALGLYGVLAYSVAQRSREIGLRVALGAPTGRIRRMVLRQVTRMAVIGVVLGAAAAWLLGRAAQSLLFGVEPGDPLMLTAAAVVVAAVALAAASIPARRASRVDPMSVLRYE